MTVQVHRGVGRSGFYRHDERIGFPVAESRRQRFVLVGFAPFDRHARTRTGDEIGVHLWLFAEHEHVQTDSVTAGYGLQDVYRDVAFAALQRHILFDPEMTALRHLLRREFEHFAQSAQAVGD